MNLHLKEIGAQVTPGAHAALISDGAGWHQRGGTLELPDNVVMITLPPYSPELIPMENVWAHLRAKKLLPSYGTITRRSQACKDAWNFLVNDPDRIRSIGNETGRR